MGNGNNVTLRDVAELAGTSHVTASRVLNHRKGAFPISEKTRQRVLFCAQKLNYQPNLMAKAMRTQRTDIVALVYCREETPHFSDDSFYMGVQGGIEESLGRHKRNLLICSVSSDDVQKGVLPRAVQQGLADGVLVFQIAKKRFFEALQNRNVPAVAVNISVRLPGIDSVVQDNEAAAKDIVRRLEEWGHRRICLIISRNAPEADKRTEEGFRSAVRSYHSQSEAEFIIEADSFSGEAGQLAVQIKRKRPDVTAFMCTSDGIAASVVRGLRKAHWRVPKDVSVVGFGAYSDWSLRVLDLTTVTMAVGELGYKAVDMLIERIEGLSGPSREQMLSSTFVRGETAGSCPVT